jgi:hypothetical protein
VTAYDVVTSSRIAGPSQAVIADLFAGVEGGSVTSAYLARRALGGTRRDAQTQPAQAAYDVARELLFEFGGSSTPAQLPRPELDAPAVPIRHRIRGGAIDSG